VQGLQTIGAQRRPSLNEAALSLAPPGGRYVVVSRRCTMIYVAAKQFRDIVDREGVVVDDAALSDAVLLYPDDTRICRHVADVQRWNAYKKQSVEELIIDSANRVTLRNFRCRSVLFCFACSALTLLVGRQEGHPASAGFSLSRALFRKKCGGPSLYE